MKYLKSAVLFCVLVFFPAISWYYLQSGLDFRKEIHAELQSDNRAVSEIFSSESLKQNLFKKTTLLVLSEAHNDAFNEIDKQFEGSNTYQMIHDTSLASDGVKGIAMLIDTAGLVKYEYTDIDDMKRIVQHLSMVIPKLPEKDIVFKK